MRVWRRATRWLRPSRIAAVVLVAVLTLTLPLQDVHHAAGETGGEHSLLAVADLRGQALLLFDPANTRAARRITLPGGPHELALLPNGRIAVSLEQAGLLAIVDIGSGEVQSIETGGLPHGLAERNGVLHVTDRDRDAVRRFDVATWRELEPLPAGRWPHALAFLPSGTLVVANAADSTLTISNRTVAASELPETVAVASDGRIATAGALGDTVEVFAGDGRLLAAAPVSGRPVRVAFSRTGTVVAAALSARGAVALVGTGSEVRTVAIGGMPDGLLFDAAGTLWVSDLAVARLIAIDVASGRVRGVFEVPGGEVRSTGAMLSLTHQGPLAGLLCPVVRQ